MNDLSHIGRPGASEERALRACAGAIGHYRSALMNGREAPKIFQGRGSAQVLEKAQFGHKESRAVFLGTLCAGLAQFG
jgi:hypothetical protein